MKKNIKESELAALLEEVQTQVEGLLKSEAAKLSKAVPGDEESSDSKAPPESSASEGSSEPPKSDPPAASPPAPAASASPDGPPADSADAGIPGMEGEGPDASDPNTYASELSQLPIEHVKAIYLGAKMALASLMGAGGSPDGGAPDGDASASDQASAPPALKAEMKAEKSNGGTMLPVKKSETDAELEGLRKKISEQDDVLGGLLKVVKTVVEAPIRKSVTSVADLAPSKEAEIANLSKAEISRKLRTVMQTNLSKSDRQLINQFTLGSIKVEGIAHLLK